MEQLISSIKKHEGFKDFIYKDSRGLLTCGWGHCLRLGSKVPPEACEALLKQDIADAINDFFKLRLSIGADIVGRLNQPRRRVIVEMLFNLGLPSVLKFTKMWDHIRVSNWDGAALEMLDSEWHRQVGHRAEALADIMRTGEE